MIKMTRKIAKAAAVAAIVAAIPAASALAAAPSGQYSCAYTFNTAGFNPYFGANPSSPVQNGGMSYLDFTTNKISQALFLVKNFNSSNPAPKSNIEMAYGTFTVSAQYQAKFPNVYVLDVSISSTDDTDVQAPFSYQLAVEPVNGGNTLLIVSLPSGHRNFPLGSGVCNRL